MMIFAGVCTLIAVLFLPETFAPVLLQWKARRLRKANPESSSQLYAEHEHSDWSLSGILSRTLLRPIEMLFREPILFLVTIYLSLVYGILYARECPRLCIIPMLFTDGPFVVLEAIPLIFMGTRGFNIGESGLIFIGVGIGSTIGAYLSVPLSKQYPQLLVKWRGFPPPEQRLFGAMIGAPLLVIGCFWLGWTGHYSSIHWIAPALATIPIGMSVALVFNSFLVSICPVSTYTRYF